jgi:hypothetical protein
MQLSNLEQDIRWILSIDHQGHCDNEGQYPYNDEDHSPCDHEYNRCYVIDSISIGEPSEGEFNQLVELVAESEKKIVKAKVLGIFKSAHEKFDFTDTSNFDWSTERDYYGDSLSYVRFSGSLLSFLQEELGKI